MAGEGGKCVAVFLIMLFLSVLGAIIAVGISKIREADRLDALATDLYEEFDDCYVASIFGIGTGTAYSGHKQLNISCTSKTRSFNAVLTTEMLSVSAASNIRVGSRVHICIYIHTHTHTHTHGHTHTDDIHHRHL